MEDGRLFKKENYLKNLTLLNIQKKEIDEILKNPIKGEFKTTLFYFVNKDVIDIFLNDGLSKDIMNLIETYKNNNKINSYIDFHDKEEDNCINYIINLLINNNFDYNKNKNINLLFQLAENFKINKVKYPDNFYIIEKKRFEKIFNKEEVALLKDLIYRVLMGKEGIFIFDLVAKETYNFYYSIDLYKGKIDLIFIFKDLSLLESELKLFIEKGRNDYCLLRDIKNKLSGYFNLIIDGKILGKYYNLYRIDNINIEDQETNQNLKQKIAIEEIKDNYIKLFIPYLLTCLSQIQQLKLHLIKRFNQKQCSKTNIISQNKKYDKLVDIFSKFICYNYDKDKKSKEIKNFINELNKINIKNKIIVTNNVYSAFFFYDNIIKVIIEELHEELSGDFPKVKNQEKKSIISDIFFGKIEIMNKPHNFSTLLINIKEYVGNQNIGLDQIINSYLFKEKNKIISFPKILIIINFNYLDYLLIPKELKILKENLNYDLLSCIQFINNANFISILKNDNNSNNSNYIKIYYDEDYYPITDILNNDDIINNSFINFYVQKDNYNYENNASHYFSNSFINNNINMNYYNSNNNYNNNYNNNIQ